MANKLDAEALLKQLAGLRKVIPALPADLAGISTPVLNRVRAEIRTMGETLALLSDDIGALKLPKVVFDPTDPHIVGKLIGDTMLLQERMPLGAVEKFYGSGVYAIYYRGPFASYAPIAGTETPIYVGKADPADRYAVSVQQQGDRLARRLADHKKSVSAAQNLELGEFDCRFLVVKTAWESTAEDYLINRFKPVWNNEMGACYGFGKHGDDAGTRSNTRSPWDTLHPGRPWAMKEGNKPNPLGVDGVKKAVADHYAKHPPLYPDKVFDWMPSPKVPLAADGKD